MKDVTVGKPVCSLTAKGATVKGVEGKRRHQFFKRKQTPECEISNVGNDPETDPEQA